MNKLVKFLFYSLLAIIYFASYWKDQTNYLKKAFAEIGLDYHTSFGGRMKYLTYIDLNFQTFYYIICALSSFYEYVFDKQRPPKIVTRIIDIFFTAIIFPLGCMVTTSFWGVYFFDRDLIYPVIVEKVIPVWQNHVNHTLPVISSILEHFFTRHKYSSSFTGGLLITWIGSLIYIAWVYIIAHYGGFWVYGILEHLGPIYRAVFISCLLVLATFFYKLGQFIQITIWPIKKSAFKNN